MSLHAKTLVGKKKDEQDRALDASRCDIVVGREAFGEGHIRQDPDSLPSETGRVRDLFRVTPLFLEGTNEEMVPISNSHWVRGAYTLVFSRFIW